MINLEAEGREKLTSLFVDRLKEALQLKTPLNFLTEFQLSAFASHIVQCVLKLHRVGLIFRTQSTPKKSCGNSCNPSHRRKSSGLR
jgi:hypothetical protein